MNKYKKLGQNGSITLIVIVLVAILAVGGAGYYVWRKNNKKTDTQQQSDSSSQQEQAAAANNTTNTTPAPSKPSCTAPSASDIANIEAAITSGNTAALQGYMANSVKVIIAASEGVGNQTPAQAVSDVTNFISGTSSWSFSLPASTIAGYKSTPYKTYFPSGAVVGKDSGTTKVISFSFDCNGKINVVFEAGQENFLQ